MSGTLRLCMVLLAAVLFAPAVLAQEEGQPQTDEERVAQELDRRLRRIGRDLDLSEAQLEEVKKILQDTVGKRDVVDQDERARIEALLTPEQKTRFEEARNRAGRGGRFGEGGAGRFEGMAQAWMGRLKEELGLTDEQAAKVQEILTGTQTEMQELFRGMREGGGNQDWDSIRQKMTEMWTGVAGKVEGVLDDSQKEKFKALVQDMQDRNPFFRGEGGRGSVPTGPEGRGGRGESPERRVERAMTALALTPEEPSILKPMVEEIEKLRADRAAMDEARQALVAALDGGAADEETLKARLADFRKIREEREAALAAKRAELQELLTLQQEARLVELGVIE
ncbi:MAG: hypothetical protein HY720_14515 [Planctomycetes bacterium]|nr:hypothetical protein [Planctomycetota bacterium]